MNIHITPIAEQDFEQLFQLIQEFATFQQMPEKVINSAAQMQQEKEFIHGFVAKDENVQIHGYVTFFFAYYTWTGKSLYMDDLYVSQTYRGQEIGTRLINKVIAHAREHNCYKLRWQVSNWNEPAIRFYESLGATVDRIELNCDLVLQK